MNGPVDRAAIMPPPHSIEAEQALLGGLMMDDRAWDRVVDVVKESDLYRDDHRRVFRHVALLSNAGKKVDVLAVFDSLERSNEADQAGGLGYLGELANGAVSVANIRHSAEIVSERAVLRKIQAAATALHDACSRPSTVAPEEIVAKAEAVFAEVLDRRTSEASGIGEVMAEALSYIDSRGDVGGLCTGFRHLDAMTGGLEPGQLVIVAARPSMGKTAFGCNVADQVAQKGGAVLLLTLEMTRREIGMRILAARTGVSMHAMRTGTKDDGAWKRMAGELKPAKEQRLWIDDKGSVSVGYVRARARRLKRTKGLDLIVIDFLGLMRGTGENRTQEIGSISRGLKALAKELQVPIIALAQLNRGVEGRQDKRPMMSDLRDSGEVEQDADIVAMLHRESYYNPGAGEWAGIAELLVRKNRNGPVGDVLLSWYPDEMRFSDYVGPHPRARSDTKPRRGFEDKGAD